MADTFVSPTVWGPFINFVSVAWGGGPVALVVVTTSHRSSASLSLVTPHPVPPPPDPPPGHITFPVVGPPAQPSDTIDPNLYRRTNIVGISSHQIDGTDTSLQAQQGAWFTYISGAGTPTEPNYSMSFATYGALNNFSPAFMAQYTDDHRHDETSYTYTQGDGEATALIWANDIFKPNYIPEVKLSKTTKTYYLIQFGGTEKNPTQNAQVIKILHSTGDDHINTEVVTEVGFLTPGTDGFFNDPLNDWIAVDNVHRHEAGHTTVPPFSPFAANFFGSFTDGITDTVLSIPAGNCTIDIKVYSGGIFEKAGDGTVTWSPWPPNPAPPAPPRTDNGSLVWQHLVTLADGPANTTSDGPSFNAAGMI